MKKMYVLALVTLVSLAGLAHAGFPSVGSVTKGAVNDAMDMGKHKVIQDEINKELGKQNCQFKDSKTHTDLTCDFNKVIDVIASRKSVIEGLGQGTIYTYIETIGSKDNRYDRRNHLRDLSESRLSWTRLSVNDIEGITNNVKVWVEVK